MNLVKNNWKFYELLFVWVFFLPFFSSANGFLNNCSLNLCNRLGSENVLYDISMTKVLPINVVPQWHYYEFLMGSTDHIALPFRTGVAKAALKFLDIKISGKTIDKFRGVSCPLIVPLHKITGTVCCLCLCI